VYEKQSKEQNLILQRPSVQVEAMQKPKFENNHRSKRAQTPHFALRYFPLLQAQRLFKQAAVSLSFLPCKVSHSK